MSALKQRDAKVPHFVRDDRAAGRSDSRSFAEIRGSGTTDRHAQERAIALCRGKIRFMGRLR
jgi:hypothetical protein